MPGESRMSSVLCIKCWGKGKLENGKGCNLCDGTGDYILSDSRDANCVKPESESENV